MSLKLVSTSSDVENHEYDITSLIYANNKVYSASDDGKIKMWSLDLKLEKEIQAHPYSVYSLSQDNDTLIFSCSSDGSIRSWKTDTLEESGCIKEPGEQEIWKCYWGDDSLAYVDDQGIITFYNTDGSRGTVVEMMEQIKDIAYKDRLLYTVRDLDLVVTEILPGDKNNYTCRGTLPGRAPLALFQNKLIYSSRDGKDIFVYLRNENQFSQIAHIKDAHVMLINTLIGGMHESNFYVYSAGWDKNVKQWQITSNGATLTSVTDVGGYVNVLCVSDNGRNIFAGGENGKIWKIQIQ